MFGLSHLLAFAAALLLVACQPEIGDSCSNASDCSQQGERTCDVTQPGGYCTIFGCDVDACPEEAIIMSNNYDMAYFTREQSIVGKNDLMKPYTFDEDQLGYRPRFPEEDVKRAKMRRDAFNLVAAARRAQEDGQREHARH